MVDMMEDFESIYFGLSSTNVLKKYIYDYNLR